MNEQFTLVSWNVRGGGRRIEQQCAYLAELNPDIVALQEVTIGSIPEFKRHFRQFGVQYVEDSSSNVTDMNDLVGPRRYTALLASKWPLVRLSHNISPWPERLLSAIVHGPFGEIKVHTAYIPPGSTNGWVKIQTLEGVYRELASVCSRHRILCGDFNTPQLETADGEIITWAQRVVGNGRVKLRNSLGTRWDSGERNVLEGLAEFDLRDVYRQLHGYAAQDYSWYWWGRGKKIGRRFDHVFASHSVNPQEFTYLHEARESGLSDHSPALCRFRPLSMN